MRYLIYLVATILAEVLALSLAPFLPLFAVRREGWCNNHSALSNSLRLPTWLSWFDTPDNSLAGDDAHALRHLTHSKYWTAVCWLARNRAYGFKWTVLAAPVSTEPVFMSGNKEISYKGPVYGTMECLSGNYWQHKSVTRLPLERCLVLNFGWLIEDGRETPALFMFSPRIKKVVYA